MLVVDDVLPVVPVYKSVPQRRQIDHDCREGRGGSQVIPDIAGFFRPLLSHTAPSRRPEALRIGYRTPGCHDQERLDRLTIVSFLQKRANKPSGTATASVAAGSYRGERSLPPAPEPPRRAGICRQTCRKERRLFSGQEPHD